MTELAVTTFQLELISPEREEAYNNKTRCLKLGCLMYK